ncbi:mitochondrial import inner membrane translocase subunit tim16 [Lasiosphaeria miniovina]|uniref:Mitochondrial import inner membrane translocase subunit TIM16 n=1 Tax=Lasiosphaeria miniovina TaxID=1954250 RepID=A0AA40A5V5_9PEZI|nr:mitochondrial import inner membrane translocase subunit tim16 [Lasiosphaeria miniovina]KAK0709884.1 mitochondrial import inner membrane translocase subunit tim16 [Lasiosphaeria miniovina]
MAYRVITQVVLIGSRVLGRAFAEAYKQASASSQYQRAQAKNPNAVNSTGRANLNTGMTLDEACKILNVKPATDGKAADMEEVMERFKRLFDSNDPEKGGSFYLQSKILRARERLEAEIGPAVEKAEQEAEVKAGWNPKIFKDR